MTEIQNGEDMEVVQQGKQKPKKHKERNLQISRVRDKNQNERLLTRLWEKILGQSWIVERILESNKMIRINKMGSCLRGPQISKPKQSNIATFRPSRKKFANALVPSLAISLQSPEVG